MKISMPLLKQMKVCQNMPGKYLTLSFVQQFPCLWPLCEQLNWQFAQAGFRLVRATVKIFSPLISVNLQPTS